MNPFPLVDPIPLPAPVWLFKVLHILTLALHFVAVQILIGGLLTAVIMSFFGSRHAMHRGASAALASRLPIVMTYVINLGVPPLLFAQVLYGTSLYTSNVLIGAYWLAVIFLLMGCYWMLYRFADGLAEGKRVWWMGLIAWFLALGISRILSTNMALMIKPEVWQNMYSASAHGNFLPPFDPTLTPRWIFMLTGGFVTSGLWMIWIAGRKTVQAPLNRFLAEFGGGLAAVMVIVQVSHFVLILQTQSPEVREGLAANPLWYGAGIGWCAAALLILIYGFWAWFKKPCGYAAGYGAALLAVLSVGSWTILRDGIRDVTLLHKGFDVWQQPVVTNWSVVLIFFAVFGLGIAALVWLISVLMRAKPVMEGGS